MTDLYRTLVPRIFTFTVSSKACIIDPARPWNVAGNLGVDLQILGKHSQGSRGKREHSSSSMVLGHWFFCSPCELLIGQSCCRPGLTHQNILYIYVKAAGCRCVEQVYLTRVLMMLMRAIVCLLIPDVYTGIQGVYVVQASLWCIFQRSTWQLISIESPRSSCTHTTMIICVWSRWSNQMHNKGGRGSFFACSNRSLGSKFEVIHRPAMHMSILHQIWLEGLRGEVLGACSPPGTVGTYLVAFCGIWCIWRMN